MHKQDDYYNVKVTCKQTHPVYIPFTIHLFTIYYLLFHYLLSVILLVLLLVLLLFPIRVVE